MEKKIILSRRFRKNVLRIYDYLIQEHSAKVAFNFLDKLQQRIEVIIQHPGIGKSSKKKSNIRSVTLQPHNRIYYRINNYRIELLCIFDMRRKNLPY
jgi:plasmid stabilization system protein ParE